MNKSKGSYNLRINTENVFKHINGCMCHPLVQLQRGSKIRAGSAQIGTE